MIEVAQETVTASPASPADAANERDFLLASAAGKLVEIAGVLIAAGNKVPDAEKAVFVQIATGFNEVLQTIHLAIKEGRPPPIVPPVAGGAITPDNDPMEARITSLEADMRDVRDRLVHVEVKLDGVDARVIVLDKKVDGLPSKDFVGAEVSKSSTKIIIWVVVAVGAAQLIPSLVVPLLRHFGI